MAYHTIIVRKTWLIDSRLLMQRSYQVFLFACTGLKKTDNIMSIEHAMYDGSSGFKSWVNVDMKKSFKFQWDRLGEQVNGKMRAMMLGTKSLVGSYSFNVFKFLDHY